MNHTPKTDAASAAGAARAPGAWARSTAFGVFLSDILQPASPTSAGASRPSGGRSASVYTIGVAARLVHMHPQTLRKYDREELVSPSRTGGMQRLYSDEDLERLRIIGRLVDGLGLNHGGVTLVLGIARRLTALELRRVIEYLSQEDA